MHAARSQPPCFIELSADAEHASDHTVVERDRFADVVARVQSFAAQDIVERLFDTPSAVVF
jgi:hypothetical protein